MLKLLLAVGLIIAGLTAFDQFLKNAEEGELLAEARHFDSKGLDLLAQGKTDDAVDALRRAHSLSRRNSKYELDLADALIAARKLGEAGKLIDDVLQREPNDGRTNLSAARLALRRGSASEAEPYYHRAIYGLWPDDAARHRITARMELIAYLESSGRKKELLAELLPLEEETGSNPGLQHRLAHLFLLAGSPGRSADLYHALIQRDPNDAAAYTGLGEAELERGRYREARNAFLQALRRKPGDPAILERSGLSSTMAALDPTPRRLPSLEKYARSLHILELTQESLEKCTGAAAQAAVPPKPPAHVTNEMAEGNLALAEQMWRERVKACGPDTAKADEALRLIMEKIEQ